MIRHICLGSAKNLLSYSFIARTVPISADHFVMKTNTVLIVLAAADLIVASPLQWLGLQTKRQVLSQMNDGRDTESWCSTA